MTKKIFINILVSLLLTQSAFAEAGGGRVGGPAASAGLDDLPTGPESASEGVVLQPPVLGEAPSSTIFIKAPEQRLSVNARLCNVDLNGDLIARSCKRNFVGTTNVPLKVLPGYYLITAGKEHEDFFTEYSSRPVHVKVNQVLQIEMKKIDLGKNPGGILLGIDYSKRSELEKALSAKWGEAAVVSPVGFVGNSSEIAEYRYFSVPVNQFLESMCSEDSAKIDNFMKSLRNNYQEYSSLYRFTWQSITILAQKFRSNPSFYRELCPQSLDDMSFWTNRFQVKRLKNENINENKDSDQYYFTLLKIQGPLYKLRFVSDSAGNVTDVELLADAEGLGRSSFGLTRLLLLKSPLYVFPGHYFVVYNFKAPWPNETKSLEKVQYGIEIK